MNKIALATTGILVAAGIGGIIYWGSTPLKTYYPNGSLHSQVDRSFFVKTGLYKQYLQNNLRFEVNYKGGKKEGYGTLYQKNEPLLQIPFKNGQPDGEIIYEGENTGINVLGDTFDALTPFGSIKGRTVCETEDFLDEATGSKEIPDNVENALKCIVFENVKSSKVIPVSISFNGAFNYPKFTKTSTFEIIDQNDFLQENSYDEMPEEVADALQRLKVKKISLTFDKNNKDVTLQSFASYEKPISTLKLDLYDLPNLIQQAKISTMTGNDAGLFDVLKNISLTGFEVNTSGEDPDLIFKGKITPVLFDIASGTTLKAFNPKGKNIFDIETTKNGFELEAKYPNSTKKLINVDVTVNDSPLADIKRIAQTAKTPSDYALKMSRSKQTVEPRFEGKLNKLEIFGIDGKSIIAVKDLKLDLKKEIMRGNVVLFDGQSNQQVLKISAANEPIQVSVKGGRDETIDFDDAPEYVFEQLQEPMLENVFKPWLQEVDTIAKEYPTSLMGVFSAGALAGYTTAMDRHKVNTLLDYTARCVVVAQTSGDGSRILTGDCNQPKLLGGYEKTDYEVEILPFSTPDTVVVQVSNVPRSECRGIEQRVGRTGYIKANTNGCPDEYNDVILTYGN